MASPEEKAPLPAAGTKVVPIHPIDQRPPVGLSRTLVFFVVRQLLDDELLRSSLDKLIRNHLPVLGAALKPAPKEGGLEEYHYPDVFPQDAVLFAWSHSSIETTLDASGLIANVATPKEAVVWGKPIIDLEAAWTPSTWPRERKDDKPDTPLLLVHITHYTDATVVALNIPHAVADQKGIAGMVEAWLLVAQGREPPEFIRLEPGALDGPKDLPVTEIRKKGRYRVKTKGEHIRSIVGLLPDLARNREESRRMMFLSADTVTALRDKSNAELQAKYGTDHVPITNGDVVTCVLAKFAKMHRKKTKNFALGATVNARGRHPSLPVEKPYLHNCPAYALARFKFSRDTPLAEMARHHRLAVIETAKTESIERSFAVTKQVFEGAGYAFPMGEPGELPYHVTNWTSAWHGIDFSVAAKAATTAPVDSAGSMNGETAVSGKKGEMLVFGHALMRKNNILRLHCSLMCKGGGGYWADFSCTTKAMALVEELLKKDPQLTSL